MWVAAGPPNGNNTGRKNFARRYREKTGAYPSLTALAAYDAVRLVAAALRESGPNRARLRDSLAGIRDFRGVSGTISFDGAGNNQAAVTIAPIQ
jgi:branched-chain amino acid transport system substrate-binding protein